MDASKRREGFDKKAGIKLRVKRDNALDKERGVPVR